MIILKTNFVTYNSIEYVFHFNKDVVFVYKSVPQLPTAIYDHKGRIMDLATNVNSLELLFQFPHFNNFKLTEGDLIKKLKFHLTFQ